MDEIFRYTLKDSSVLEEIIILNAKEDNVIVVNSSGEEEVYTIDYIDVEAIKNTILNYEELFDIVELPVPPEEVPTSVIVVWDEDESHEIVAENLNYWDVEGYMDPNVKTVSEIVYIIADLLSEYGIEMTI